MLLPLICWPSYQPMDKIADNGTRIKEVADRSSYYGHIKVVDYSYQERHIRDMLIDGLTQGGVDVVSRLPLYEYPYLMEALPYGLHPEGKSALMIGLGAGMIPMWYEQQGVSVDVVEIAVDLRIGEVLAIDQALDRLRAHSPRKADIVLHRYFAGLTMEQAAKSLGLSKRTAERHWTYARAWLLEAME